MNQKIILTSVFVALFIGASLYFIFNKSIVTEQLPVVSNNNSVTEEVSKNTGAEVVNVQPSATNTISNLPVSIKGDTFSVDLNGYVMQCSAVPTYDIYRKTNNLWDKVLIDDLPPAGLYYLDNSFIGYGMNDNRSCSCVSMPKFTTQLLWHKKVGMKAPPKDSGSLSSTVPVYVTSQFTGDIKIDVNYFSDKECKDKKISSSIIKI